MAVWDFEMKSASITGCATSHFLHRQFCQIGFGPGKHLASNRAHHRGLATMPDMVRDSRDIEMASDERYDKLLMEEVEWQKSSGLTKECKAPFG